MLDDIDWKQLAIIGLVIWIGTKVSRALSTLRLTVERANNYGLTDAEDSKAVATLARKGAPLAERKEASATLRRKFDGAVAAGYGSNTAVVQAGKALDILDHALAEEDKLAIARAEWEKRRAAKVIPLTPRVPILDGDAGVEESKKKGPATQ